MTTPCFELPIKIYYEDTDAGGIVYHSKYLNFMERARSDWLSLLGISLTKLEQEQQLMFVVKSVNINYRKPAKLADQLVVKSSIKTCSKTRIRFSQNIFHDDELLIEGLVEVVCIDSQRLKPKALPLLVLQEFQNV